MTHSFGTDEMFRNWEPPLQITDIPQEELRGSGNKSRQRHTLLGPVLASIGLHTLVLSVAIYTGFHQSRNKEPQPTGNPSLQVRFVSAAPQALTPAEAAPEEAAPEAVTPEQQPPARTVVEQVPPPTTDQVTELPSPPQPVFVTPTPDQSEDAPRLLAPMLPDIRNSVRSAATATDPGSGYNPACDTRQQRNELIDCGSSNNEGYDYASAEQNPVTLFFALPVATDTPPATRDRTETANRVRANIDMVESFLTANRTKRAVLGQP